MTGTRRTKMMSVVVVLAALPILLGATCIRKATKPTIERADKAIAALNSAVTAASRESGDWRSEVVAFKSEFEEYRDDLKDVLGEVTGGAGAEFRCNADFVRKRGAIILENLRRRIWNTRYGRDEYPQLPLLPTICTVSPLDLRVGHVAGVSKNEPFTLKFYGYDLRSDRDYRLVVFNASGESRTVVTTSDVSHPSEYVLTARVDPTVFSCDDRSIHLLYGDEAEPADLSSISVLSQSCDHCVERNAGGECVRCRKYAHEVTGFNGTLKVQKGTLVIGFTCPLKNDSSAQGAICAAVDVDPAPGKSDAGGWASVELVASGRTSARIAGEKSGSGWIRLSKQTGDFMTRSTGLTRAELSTTAQCNDNGDGLCIFSRDSYVEIGLSGRLLDCP